MAFHPFPGKLPLRLYLVLLGIEYLDILGIVKGGAARNFSQDFPGIFSKAAYPPAFQDHTQKNWRRGVDVLYNRGIHTGVGLPEAQRRHVSMKKNIINKESACNR